MRLILVFVFAAVVALFSFRSATTSLSSDVDSLRYSEEKHFKNLRQLTFGGDNAEAYWSFDSKMVSFQSNNKDWGLNCDQIFYMPIEGMDLGDGTKKPTQGVMRRIYCPDPEVLWVPFATRAARKIVRAYGIDTMLITMPPYSSILVGLQFVFASFFLSVLQLKRLPGRNSDAGD